MVVLDSMKQASKELTIYKNRPFFTLTNFYRAFEKRAANPVYANGFALLLSAVAIMVLYYNNLTFSSQRISTFLLFFPIVVLASWYGGFIPGVVATILVTSGVAGIYYLQVSHSFMFPVFIILQLSIFVIEGVIISLLISRARKFDQINTYIQQIKAQQLSNLSLTAELEKAKKDIKARDEFLSFVSHELKTPLTAMLLQSQSALHSIRNVSLANFSIERLLKMLENSEEQTKQLSKMVNDLMNVSLITTGKLELEKQAVNLGDLVNTVISKMEDKASQEGYDVTTEIEEGVVGKWDPMRLEQVVTNLFSNAIKYGNKKPIAITVTAKHKEAKLIIEDNGIGISNDMKAKIFNRFERGENAHQFEGLGIGLYLSSQIVRAHDGSIEVKSKPGKGSIFTVSLPL
jgi:signal transduction histidine kinase